MVQSINVQLLWTPLVMMDGVTFVATKPIHKIDFFPKSIRMEEI